MKLHETLTSKTTATFKLDEREIRLGRFTLNTMIEYEKDDITIQQLIDNITNKPAIWATRFAWDIMNTEDKAEFETLDNFRSCLALDHLKGLSDAIIKAINASMPKGETEEEKNTEKKPVKVK